MIASHKSVGRDGGREGREGGMAFKRETDAQNKDKVQRHLPTYLQESPRRHPQIPQYGP